jgi:glycosidase
LWPQQYAISLLKKKIKIFMKKAFTLVCLFFFIGKSSAQYNSSYKCYPANWWPGMKMNTIQLMIYGDAVGNADTYTISYPGVKINKITKAANNNYVFIDISISSTAKPGIVKIIPKHFRATTYIPFELKARRANAGKTFAQGVTSADFVYLIMPDRFSNGDESNDKFADMNDTSLSRANGFLRHGGDLKGIENHLDYLKDLGVTALWLTPVIENNMHLTDEGGTQRSTYHGYAFTNHYVVDKRFGGNEAYKSLIDAAHKKGIKIVQDAVYNHVGNDHFFIKDMPMKNWVHQWPVYTNTTYKDQPLTDPYASEADKKIVTDGWFTPFMPDLDQTNPFVANYLIQNIIWSVEEFGIDGWRVDTYYYSDRNFLNKINQALYTEYPAITVWGESTVSSIVNSAFFTKNKIDFSFKHNTKGTLDFTLSYAMLDALKQNFGWSEGVSKLYTTLANDAVYENPMNNAIFFDNHDMHRFFSEIGENPDKYTMGMAWLLTLRGTPQLYYGTEILMKNFKDPTDAEVRRDFPGGWKEDTVNKFDALSRTVAENDAFTFIKTLANFRKTAPAVQTGKLMQYVPKNGVYVYFRYTTGQTVMVVSNTTKEDKPIFFIDYAERTAGFGQYKNIFTGAVANADSFTLPAGKVAVLELQK